METGILRPQRPIAEELRDALETTRAIGAVFSAARDVEGFARVVYALERILGRPILLIAKPGDEAAFSRSVAARVALLLRDPPQPTGAPPGTLPPPGPLPAILGALQAVAEHYDRQHPTDPTRTICRWFKPLPLPYEQTIAENGAAVLELKIPSGKRRRPKF